MTEKNAEYYGKLLAEACLEIQAVQLNTERPFLWVSGYYMPIYNDNRMLLIKAEYRKLIAEAFEALIRERGIAWEYIAGTSTAGIPHAAGLADRLSAPLTYVRDKPKKHGMGNRIEGLAPGTGYGGGRVILIEDLISTGGSSAEAVQAVREAGGEISYCLSIFSYGLKKAEDRFAAMNPSCVPLSILTYQTLIESSLRTGYIDNLQYEKLIDWHEDPFGWGRKHGFSV